MNQSALRLFVRSIITEAKEAKKSEKKETKLPKSSGKLMDLKKELAALEQYRDEIQVAKFAEKTAETEVEFADLAKFKKELDAIKEKGVKLESDLEAKIEEIKAKIDVQKNKIKEMIGMTPKAGQKIMEDEDEPENQEELDADQKADMDHEANKLSKYDEAKEGNAVKAHMEKLIQAAKTGNAKKDSILAGFAGAGIKYKVTTAEPNIIKYWNDEQGLSGEINLDEVKKPSAGMTKKAKSAVAKKAHAGGDIGKKGKGFEKVEKAAEKKYGSKEAGQKVAAAAMWKGQAKK